MTEAAIRLAHQLAHCTSPGMVANLLIAAPVLSPPDVMEVARHPEKYGITGEEAQHLQPMEGLLGKVLEALTGELDETVPAQLYGLLAMTSRQQRKPAQAKRFYQYAFANSKTAADKAAALGGTALLEMEQGNTDRARTIFLQAEGICERGAVKGGGTGQEACPTERDAESGGSLGYLLSNHGTLEMEQRQWAAAADLFEKSLQIGRGEPTLDVYALARLNQAELAFRQGNAAAASQYLDDIQWVEAMWPARAQEYQAMRRRVAGAEAEGPDPETQTIEALEQRLSSPGGLVTAADGIERARVQKALGAKYFARREGRRIENVQAAVNYWEAALNYLETGKVAGKPVLEFGNPDAAKAVIAEMHGDLGRAYNEWYTLDHTASISGKARAHFEAALKILPEGAEFADYRRTLVNNMANAVAWDARESMSWIVAGQPDRDSLNQSLNAQAQLLQELGNDPVGRVQVLVNLSQTYCELAEANPDAARDSYYPAAWDCVIAAEKTLEATEKPDEALVLAVAAKKAQVAADIGHPAAELEGLCERLDALLRSANLAAMPAALWANAYRETASLARLLGQKARCYRQLLVCMRKLRLRIASVPVALDAALADLHRTNGDLIGALTEWDQLDRAAFFAGTRPSERTRIYSPGRRWRAPAGSCAILFQPISRKNLSAFVITPAGVKVRKVADDPLEVVRDAGRFLSAKLQGDDPALTSDAWLSAIDWVSGRMGEKLLRPLEDLLPPGGQLAFIGDAGVSRTLPLQLAALADGKPLLNRFDVTYQAQLRFENRSNAASQKPQPSEVFIASYSPAEARLPFANLEARAVAECYGGGPQVSNGDAATPETVLRGLENSRVAHLSCHGNFDWDSPLDSVLTFAGRGLSVREIQLTLARSPCDLIVLSACEAGARGSGGGDATDFASVLLQVGCGMVIAAVWRIDDLSTTVLMAMMHEALAKGMGAAEALAAAQRKMQMETANAMAERAYGWFHACAAELTPEEQAYVKQKLEALAAVGNAAVFAHPVYWGSFSANRASFLMEREVFAKRPKGESA